jgi:hypothetical protein
MPDPEVWRSALRIRASSMALTFHIANRRGADAYVGEANCLRRGATVPGATMVIQAMSAGHLQLVPKSRGRQFFACWGVVR